MESQSGDTIISGIEPVDELMGGLDRGKLYLVHGESSGKSLFGITFLIEGLKQGENGAFVIRYSPEDAVRRFARLGYDCLEDVYSGRLVILEYSDDVIQKIGKLRELTPVLRELEWLLGETRPERLVFDPLTSVLAGVEGNLDTHAREFAEWARSFGATVVLIARDSNHDIIRCFEPLVAESFRFDVRESGDRFIAFEKSPAIADQAIEVDESRGVFLLGRWYAPDEEDQAAPHPQNIVELASLREDLRSTGDRIQEKPVEALADVHLNGEASSQTDRPMTAPGTSDLTSDHEGVDTLQTRKLTPVEEKDFQAPRERLTLQTPDSITNEGLEFQLEEPVESSAPAVQDIDGQLDELSDLLDDRTDGTSPLDLDVPDRESAYDARHRSSIVHANRSQRSGEQYANESREAQSPVPQDIRERAFRSRYTDSAKPRPPLRGRASDVRIDKATAIRAVEMLLRPPASDAKSDMKSAQPTSRTAPPRRVREATPNGPLGDYEARAKDFNVLMIGDDPATYDLVNQTLGDYTAEVAHDCVSGLAKLISFNPDLVVLDFDLPIVDGFKVLTLIRAARNVPIIVVSGSRMRAIDRVMASELGADYYLTKPFSAKELKHKARQLIARYRGINSWITKPSSGSRAVPSTRSSEPAVDSTPSTHESSISYTEFAVEVEKRVIAAMDNGAPLSIVGCQLGKTTADRERMEMRLFEIARGLSRDSDLIATNPPNNMVILLTDADLAGARAFAGRLQERVIEELKHEPALWVRNFPDLEESSEAAMRGNESAQGGTHKRRSGDTETSG